MITYEQIQKANEGMTGIDFKGKNYVMVNSRVTAFRKLFPEGFIITDMISHDNGICVMQAKVGYYQDGNPVTLGTGMAFEKQDSTYINKTSYIENCETSAVGRALGFLALGSDDSICSAEELVNAITNQQKPEAPKPVAKAPAKPVKQDAPATVEAQKKVPAANPVQAYINNEMAFMSQRLEISDRKEMREKFAQMRKALIYGGVIPDIPADKITMEQAKQMIEAMYVTFFTDGEKK